MSEQIEVRDKRDLGAFIPAALDDYGLTPYEFRIYARLVRRAGKTTAYESVANLASACKMSEQKVKVMLRFLSLAGMVSRHSRPGTSSVYTVEDQRNWAHPEMLDAMRKQASYHPGVGVENTQVLRTPRLCEHPGVENTQGVGVENTQGVGVENTHKGTPMKVLPKGTPLRDQYDESFADANAAIAPSGEIEEKATNPVPEQQTENLGDVTKSKVKVPRRRRKTKAVPERSPELFEIWWQTYYEFCLDVGQSAGGRQEAAAIWDELLESEDCLSKIQEGSTYYAEAKRKQFKTKGEAIGVSHGIRFLRDRKWQEALDYKNRSASKSSTPSASLQAHDWESDPRTPQWRIELDQHGNRWHKLNGVSDPEKYAFWRWQCDRWRQEELAQIALEQEVRHAS